MAASAARRSMVATSATDAAASPAPANVAASRAARSPGGAWVEVPMPTMSDGGCSTARPGSAGSWRSVTTTVTRPDSSPVRGTGQSSGLSTLIG